MWRKVEHFQTQTFFMIVIILRKQSYADFICNEACGLASVLLGFFLWNSFALFLGWNFKLDFSIISNTSLRFFQDDKCGGNLSIFRGKVFFDGDYFKEAKLFRFHL